MENRTGTDKATADAAVQAAEDRSAVQAAENRSAVQAAADRSSGSAQAAGKDKTRAATIAALLTCVIYGFSFMFSRIALEHTSSYMLLAIRFTISTAVMLLLAVFGPFSISLRGKPVFRFLMMGLCQPVIYFIGETAGIQYTNSSFAGIMIAIIPVVTVLLSSIFLHEHLTLKTFGWILCSVAGAFIISAAQTSSGAIQLRGVLMLLVAVLSASVFYVLSRSTSNAFTSFERTFIMMVMGFVFFTGQALVHEKTAFFPMMKAGFTDPYVILPILYLSLISSVIAFMLQNYSVTYISLARITVYENIIPVISICAGVFFLGEPFTPLLLAGMVLILLGVYKVTKST